MVVTGEMSGCALQVNSYHGRLIFNYNSDSKHLGILHHPRVDQLLRIEAHGYMPILFGQTIVEASP
jgi:hypothetical protein